MQLDVCDYVISDSDYPASMPVPIFDPLATMVMARGLHNYQYVDTYLDVKIVDAQPNN